MRGWVQITTTMETTYTPVCVYDTKYKDPQDNSKVRDFTLWTTRKKLQREIKLKTQCYLSQINSSLPTQFVSS